MIPAIIMILMRSYQRNHPESFLIIRARVFYIARIILFLPLLPIMVTIARAQEKRFSYTIKRNGSTVGNMNVREIKAGGKISLKLQSEIKTSFIFTFTAKGIEEAVFDRGLLVYSSVYQKLNGSEKINRQIKYVNNSYVITSAGEEEKLDNIKIYYNLICLYSHEPLSTTVIYSDKYQRFLSIHKIEDHHYKIKFPDGNTNEYYYQNGICIKVRIDHSWYNAVMELNQQ